MELCPGQLELSQRLSSRPSNNRKECKYKYYTYKGLTGKDYIIIINLENLEEWALLIGLGTKLNNVSQKKNKK